MFSAFLAAFLGNALLLSVLAYLSKSIIQQHLSKDLEKYKADLQANTEMYKQNLALMTSIAETKFKKLHEDVAKTLGDTFPLLWEHFHNVGAYVCTLDMNVAPGTDSKEEKLKVDASSKRFWDYFWSHRIYYHKDLYNRIEEFANLLNTIANDFTQGRLDEQRGEYSIEHWTQSWQSITQKAAPLFDEMCDDFQKRLGFEIEQEHR